MQSLESLEYKPESRYWVPAVLGGRYMGFHSQRILGQAGFSGVFFAAKILRGELPRYRLPLAEFAANVIPCSAPLIGQDLGQRVRIIQKRNIWADLRILS